MSTVRRRWVVAGVAVAVSLAAAVAALVPVGDHPDADSPPPSPTGTASLIRQLTFTGDPAVEGFCWLTVTLTDGRPHNLTVRWGDRQKEIWQSTAGPVVYSFPKYPALALPLVVEVADGVEVVFAEGPAPPPGASDEGRNGWAVVSGS